MEEKYDCRMCKYYVLEVTGTNRMGSKIIETCIESDIQELIPDKRICMAFLEKESLL